MSEGSQGKEEGLQWRYSPLELMCHLVGLSSKCNHAATGECSKPGEEEGGAKWTSTLQSGSTGSQEDSGKPQLGSSLDLFGSESNSTETVSRESGNVQETNSLERSWDSLGDKRQTSSLDLFASSSDEQTATTSESKNVSHPQKRVRFDLLTGSLSQDSETSPGMSPGTAEEVEANGHITSPLSQPKDVLDIFKCYSGCESLRCSLAEPYRMGRVFRMVVHWGSVKEGEGCITRAKWSPDGTHLLSSGQDCKSRVLLLPLELQTGIVKQLPEMKRVLTVNHSEPVYDLTWYPRMDSHDPASCCFATCTKDHPVQLWNASLGHVQSCYYSYQRGSLVAPTSLAFSVDGERLHCGIHNSIKTFSTSRPGGAGVTRPLPRFGAVSCVTPHPSVLGVSALGSRTGGVLLCSDNAKIPVGVIPVDRNGGVTQTLFSPTGLLLLTGYRATPWLHCWDLRRPDKPLHIMRRKVSNCQPVYFDLFRSHYIISGETGDGAITGWDFSRPRILPHSFKECLRPCLSYTAHAGTVTACSVHPLLPLLATAVCMGPCCHSDCLSSHFHNDQAIKVWSLLGKGTGKYEKLLQKEITGLRSACINLVTDSIQ